MPKIIFSYTDNPNEVIQRLLSQIEYEIERCPVGMVGKVRQTQEVIDHSFNVGDIDDNQRYEYTDQLKQSVKNYINSCICDNRSI